MEDFSEGEDSTSNTVYSQEYNPSYQYNGPTEHAIHPTRRPPNRRQTELLQGVLEPVRGLLGPDTEARKIFSKYYTS